MNLKVLKIMEGINKGNDDNETHFKPHKTSE